MSRPTHRFQSDRSPALGSSARSRGIAALCLLIGVALAPAAPSVARLRKSEVARPAADDSVLLQEIADAARRARELCFPRIHHDTVLFEDCLIDFGAKSGTSAASKLGVTYFGWVGAMNSVRMGMQGSDDTAARFLAQLKPLQKRLNISDTALCQTIQGDCDVRMAQMKEQRLSNRKPPPRPEETGHAH